MGVMIMLPFLDMFAKSCTLIKLHRSCKIEQRGKAPIIDGLWKGREGESFGNPDQ